MKDITDYFGSPRKARSSSEAISNPELVVEICDLVCDQNKIQNDNSLAERAKVPSKIGKKRRRQKPADPEVQNNVAQSELLSKNNLNIISPNGGVCAKLSVTQSPKTNKKKLKRESDIGQIPTNLEDGLIKCKPKETITKTGGEDSKTTANKNLTDFSVEMEGNKTQSPELPPRVNAFQFLMNSRNNVIGLNSGGKTTKEEGNSFSEGKEKLEARKNLFKNWADQKGASKRKREEEGIENCINLKMVRRAKRLKKLLHLDTPNGINEVNRGPELPLKTKKKVKQLLSSSESENSNDLTLVPIKDTKAVKVSLVEVGIIEENAQDIIISPHKKHKEIGQGNSLLNFFGVISKENKQDVIEVFEDEESDKKTTKEVIKIKMFTPQSTKRKSSMNRNRTRSVDSLKTDESSQEDHKVKRKKKKHKTRDIEQTTPQNETKFNDSMEDFCSSNDTSLKKDTNKGNLKKSKNKKERVKGKVISKEDVIENSNSTNCGTAREVGESKIDSKNSNENTNKSSFSKNSSLREDLSEHVRQDSNVSNSIEIVLEVADGDESTQGPDLANFKRKQSRKFVIDDDSMDVIDKDSEEVLVQDYITKSQSNSQKDEPGEGRTFRKRNVVNYNTVMTIDLSKSTKKGKEKAVGTPLKDAEIFSKDESIEKVELSSDSEDEESQERRRNTSIKVAPIFLKATPKQKIDPDKTEARKMFLFSGVPDSLKRNVEKQKSLEEKEYEIFPPISHIQQKCASKFWKLSNPNLNYLKLNSPSLPIDAHNLKCQNLIVKNLPYEINLTTEVKKVKHLKSCLQEIKSQNPDYPVFKVFRHIYEKSGGHCLTNTKRSPKKRSKTLKRRSLEGHQGVLSESSSVSRDHEMWTDKYSPRCSEEILGNYRSVNELKKWLVMWMNYSDEINARKRQRENYNSESEFESTDCDSRDSTRLPGNTMILYGPSGSGKTSAVYAIAKELGFNVLELNASTKRTGKRLLQELQEATQSHQVRKSEANVLANFMNPATKRDTNSNSAKKAESKGKTINKKSMTDSTKDSKKMCILLLEDIDLIFEQDDGFLSSLWQLIDTSKRPIILTITDNSPPHVQRFINQYECISFQPLTLQCLGVWLQIVCLVEGLLVDQNALGNLLEYNKGDIRKTLLQVQFWCQSGGQLEKNRVFPLNALGNSGVKDLKAPDEELHIDVSEDEAHIKENFIHNHCLGSFEIFRVNEEYSIPQNIDLGMLWWNFPNLLDVPSGASERLHGRVNVLVELPSATTTDKDEGEDEGRLTLNSLSSIYDSLILMDSLFQILKYHSSNEPVVKNWSVDLLDSQELAERREDRNVTADDLVKELSHTVVNGCIENYRKLEGTNCALNMALPDSTERRWRTNQHVCENFLKSPIPLSNILDRKSVALDYLPMVRDIARSEEKRAASNTKRRNRFRHYFKDLNMDFKQSTCKLACNILNIE